MGIILPPAPSKGGIEPTQFFQNEIDTQLEISQRLNFISSQLHTELELMIQQICKMIQGMIKYQKSKLIKQN